MVKVAKAFKDAKIGGDGTYGICVSKGDGTSLGGGQNSVVGLMNCLGAYYGIWMDDGSGKLVYSTIQDKMKTALTKIQTLYKDGILRQDFSVKDSATAGEDVASGKVGITFGTYWASLGTIGDCIENDKTADWEILEAPTADGSTYVTQTSASPYGFIFVKKGTEHPEAVVKALNLTFKLKGSTDYGTTKSGVERFKYMFPNGLGISEPFDNLYNGYQKIAEALKSGDASGIPANHQQDYEHCKAVADGKGDASDIEYNLVFGPSGTYSIINKMKDNKQMLVDADMTLPTATQTSSDENLRTTLNTAILKVIMGDDISTFDSAVSAWKSGGGDKMTQELNDWYSKNK
jgi:putative aldouronate transport system substrate-binding protein